MRRMRSIGKALQSTDKRCSPPSSKLRINWRHSTICRGIGTVTPHRRGSTQSRGYIPEPISSRHRSIHHVVLAEIELLADHEAELTVRQNLFLASVNLIVALGGGWDTVLLPTQTQRSSSRSSQHTGAASGSKATSHCSDNKFWRNLALSKARCNRDRRETRRISEYSLGGPS